MILLQAMMMGGLILLISLGGFLLFGIPLLTGLFLKSFWKLTNQRQKIADNIPYYKDPLPFIMAIGISFIILLGLFDLLIIWLDKAFPTSGYFN